LLDEEFLLLDLEDLLELLNHHTEYIMSMPAIQNVVKNGLSSHHLIIAVILILKHATLLQSDKPEAALTQAELDYQESNIDLKIQEYLNTLSSADVGQFAGFIKAAEIVSSQSSVKAEA